MAQAEELMGEAFKKLGWKREDFVVSTKVGRVETRVWQRDACRAIETPHALFSDFLWRRQFVPQCQGPLSQALDRGHTRYVERGMECGMVKSVW